MHVLCSNKANDATTLGVIIFYRFILNCMLVDMCLLRCILNVLPVQNLSVHQFIGRYCLVLFKRHFIGGASSHLKKLITTVYRLGVV